jgi:RNA polymerase sigma-70 factor (ECF subfamily)
VIDEDTLRAIWDAHADRLLLIARSVGEPAEDAVQEAFIALATQSEVPDDPLAWLVRTVRNRLIQWHRSRTRRRNRERDVGESRWFQRADSAGALSVDSRVDAEDAAAALRRLESPSREIVVMHVWGEMSFEAIADVVGGSRATVHRQFHRGLRQLQQRLTEPSAEQTTPSVSRKLSGGC